MKTISPQWAVPPHIHAASTTRFAGHSLPPYQGLNLGLHVKDNQNHVLKNRAQIVEHLRIPSEPAWLNQTHSTKCIVVEETPDRNADAAITRTPGHCLAIMTADCLPILLCDKTGKEVAAIHAGWRGLVDGVIEQTLSKMQTDPSQLLAWIGPSICGKCYEVGDDVYKQFQLRYDLEDTYFVRHQQKWLSNQSAIATHILSSFNLSAIYPSNLCTFEDKTQFYSYRRDGETGRIATFIWIEETYS